MAGAQRTTRQCRWCGIGFAVVSGPGRPRAYCKRSHRQRHYEAQQAAARLGLGPDDVLVSKGDLEALRDRIYVLESAIEDVRRDLGVSNELQDYADAYVHLLEGALAVTSLRLEPRAVGGA